MKRYLQTFILVFLAFWFTGCLDVATSDLTKLTIELLEDDDAKWEVSGDYLVYKLKEKELRVQSSGNILLYVETASGQTPISINSLNSRVSQLFVKRAGVKGISESAVADDSDVKEALINEAINEINKSFESTNETIEIEKSE